MKKEYHLVVSFDTTKENVQNMFLDIMKQHGREIVAAVNMAHNAIEPTAPKPHVRLWSDDFLAGEEDQDLKPAPEEATAGDSADGKS
jgi:hypothetical protein